MCDSSLFDEAYHEVFLNTRHKRKFKSFDLFYDSNKMYYFKEKLKCKYYIRYMDDLIILSNGKEKLVDIFQILEEEIKKYKLFFNDKTEIRNLKHGINYLGYKYILNNKKLIVTITNKNYQKIKNQINKETTFLKKFHKVKNYNGYLKAINKDLLSK